MIDEGQGVQDWLAISIPRQRLWLCRSSKQIAAWPVSTAVAGAGERQGSGATPRGWHRIRAMIGAAAAPGTVFVGRRPTGEIYRPELAAREPERDWILSRILWLTGTETGRNRGGAVDTLRRFIYIHGTPETEPMGEPRSHGCIRMHSEDVVALFDRCHPGMPVLIEDGD